MSKWWVGLGLLAVVVGSSTVVAESQSDKGAAANDTASKEVVRVELSGISYFPGARPKLEDAGVHWYSPDGIRIEEGGQVSVIPTGQPFMYTLDARKKVAERWPDTWDVGLPAPITPSTQFVDYLGYHCQVVETVSPAGLNGTAVRWFVPLAGHSVMLWGSSSTKGALYTAIMAVRVDEHASAPPGGFGIPPGYTIVEGKV
jgi:hypothetical protein